MPTRVVCTGCGKRFAVADDPARKKLPNCPTCTGVLALDAAPRSSISAHDPDSVLDLLLRGEPSSGRMMPRPPVIPLSFEERAEFNWIPWACGGGVLLLALIIGVVAYSFVGSSTSDAGDTALKSKIAAENRLRAATAEDDDPKPAGERSPAEKPTPLKASPAPTTGPRQPTKVSPDDDTAEGATASPSATPDDKATSTKETTSDIKTTGATTAAKKLEERKKKPREKMSVADLIDTVGDGVVHVTVHDDDGEPFATGSGLIVACHKIDEWLPGEVKGTEQPKPGKGDLWLVATNYHVVAGSSKIVVRLRDGRPFEARGLAALSRERDLAIIALDEAPDDLTILEPAAEATFRQGEDVVAIGHPKGFDFTVSTGIISAIRGSKNLPEEIADEIDAPADQQWIQTTAAITNGNSGGPLLTMFGEVVGINTWGLNTNGNLAFASHVKHMVELQKSALEISGNLIKVKFLSFASAKPVEAPEKIGDRDNWLESEVREELTRSTKRSLAINWRPATKGDYTSFQHVATMLTIAAVYRYDVKELKPIADSMRKRVWDFDKEVGPINRYAVEYLEKEHWGVFLLGKVRRVNGTVKRKFWLDVAGRGHVVAVTIPTNQPAPKLEVGDEVALFGYCIGTAPENSQLKRVVPNILAGFITETKLPSEPEDTALQAAYDLITYAREDQGFEDNVHKFNEMYPRVIPMLGKTGIRWQRIELNSRGRQFDAVRFSVPPELPADLLWAYNDPHQTIEDWGILPVGDFPIRGKSHSLALKGFTAPGLTREESYHLHVKSLGDGMLVPNEDYLLWFAFKDAQPQKVSIAVRLVPTGAFKEGDSAGIGAAMRDGVAFKPDILARMTKALKEKSLTAGAPAPEAATNEAVPKESVPPSDDAKIPAAEPPKAEK